MEMNVEITNVMRILRQQFPVQRMIDQKQLENIESFKYLGGMLTNGERCTRETKYRIAVVEPAFDKKRAPFTSKMELELRKKLVKCNIWKKYRKNRRTQQKITLVNEI
jgi:hypothetical protein